MEDHHSHNNNKNDYDYDDGDDDQRIVVDDIDNIDNDIVIFVDDDGDDIDDDDDIDDIDNDNYSDIDYDPTIDPHRAWSEQSVRQQLWDALRLARCVLFEKAETEAETESGTETEPTKPTKTEPTSKTKNVDVDPLLQQQQQQQKQQQRPEWKYQRVSNHMILHAIKRVAEMKLELIDLQQIKQNQKEELLHHHHHHHLHRTVVSERREVRENMVVSPIRHEDDQDVANNHDDDNCCSIRRLLFADDKEEEEVADAQPPSPLLNDVLPSSSHPMSSSTLCTTTSNETTTASTNFELILHRLYDKVDEASKQTAAKIDALHLELAEAQQEQKHRWQQQQQQHHQQGVEPILKEENDTKDNNNVLKDSSPPMDVTDDETAISSKDVEIAIWKDRCEELEALVLRPTSMTQRLLKKIVSSSNRPTATTHSEPSSTTARGSDDDDDNDDGDGHNDYDNDDDEDIRHEASKVLSQIDDWNHRQQKTVNELSIHLDTIKERVSKKSEEVEFLDLQRQLLISDNEHLRSTQRQNLASIRTNQEYEIATLLRDESRRVQQMEALEVELTHLAFSNVDLEDTTKELCHVKKDEWFQEIAKMKEESQRSSARLRAFHEKVKRSLEMQSVRLGLDVLTEEDSDDGDVDGGDGNEIDGFVAMSDEKNEVTSTTASGEMKINSTISPSFDSDTDSTRSATTVTSLTSVKKKVASHRVSS